MAFPSLLRVLLVSLAAVSSLSGRAAGQERGFAVGQRLPELVLPTIEGDRNVALSDLRGKRLLLIQFASW